MGTNPPYDPTNPPPRAGGPIPVDPVGSPGPSTPAVEPEKKPLEKE